MEIKSVLCARSKHSYIVHLNHCEQPYTQCAHPNRFEILYYMPLKLKPNLPNGQTFFLTLAGISIWSYCVFISHLWFGSDWPHFCITVRSTIESEKCQASWTPLKWLSSQMQAVWLYFLPLGYSFGKMFLFAGTPLMLLLKLMSL